MSRFASPEALKAWLSAQNISLVAWGQQGHKTVENLWHELNHGESVLQADPLLRLVKVVQVLIRRGDRMLVETAQTLGDGRQRERQRPPSEKIHPEEEVLEAAYRCLREELQLGRDRVTLYPDTCRFRHQELLSPSYPGLPSRYLLYTIEASVDGLPDTPFTTREFAAGPGDPVNIHHWDWVLVPGSPNG